MAAFGQAFCIVFYPLSICSDKNGQLNGANIMHKAKKIKGPTNAYTPILPEDSTHMPSKQEIIERSSDIAK